MFVLSPFLGRRISSEFFHLFSICPVSKHRFKRSLTVSSSAPHRVFSISNLEYNIFPLVIEFHLFPTSRIYIASSCSVSIKSFDVFIVFIVYVTKNTLFLSNFLVVHFLLTPEFMVWSKTLLYSSGPKSMAATSTADAESIFYAVASCRSYNQFQNYCFVTSKLFLLFVENITGRKL